MLLSALSTVTSAQGLKSQKPAGASVTGTLIFDGKSVPMNYAYALDVDNVEESGFLISGPQKIIILVLSDRALPPSSVTDRNLPFSERHSISEIFQPLTPLPADKMRGILLKIDASTFKLVTAQLLYPGNMSQFSVIGADIPDQIKLLKSRVGQLIGTAQLPASQNTGFSAGPKKYQYHVKFQIPLRKEPAITQKWEGKEALDSPPVQSLKEYLAAAKSGDISVLQKLTAHSHLSYLKKPEVLTMLKSGDAALLADQVKRVVMRGNSASVICVNEKPNFSIVSIQLTKENGSWKLYWP